jgi:hypothetical protein
LAIIASARGEEPTVGASTFIVRVMDPATHEWRQSQGSVVPLRPGEACFAWQLYVMTESATITVRETFNTPASPAHWPDNPDIKILDGGRVAEVSLTFPIRASTWIDQWTGRRAGGWIGHGWCIEAGDPAGTHVIDVREHDHLLHRFCFLVIPDDADRAAPQWGAPAECGTPIS